MRRNDSACLSGERGRFWQESMGEVDIHGVELMRGAT